MYVLASIDNAATPLTAKDVQATSHAANPCSVGQWVTVSRKNSWLPSASIAWNAVTHGLSQRLAHVADKLMTAVAGVLPGSASAQGQRPGGANSRHRA
jgi:hypothetical protein